MIPDEHYVTVFIPPGIPATGGIVRVYPGLGGVDTPKAPSRDLLIRITPCALPDGLRVVVAQDPSSSSSGDVELDWDVTLSDVLCGFQHTIAAFDGALKHEVGRDAYVRPDREIVVPNMGLPTFACFNDTLLRMSTQSELAQATTADNNLVKRGALRIHLRVRYPPDAEDLLIQHPPNHQLQGGGAGRMPLHKLKDVFVRMFAPKSD